MKKKCFITIVNEDYKEYVGQLIKSHSLFSNIDLIVYTINFELTDIKSEKVIFKQYFDKNLWEYENSHSNDIIKNQYEKHKYTTLLKPLILKESLNENYDDFLFIDCDGLLTKNSDVFFSNIVDSIGEHNFPISVKYFHQYSLGNATDEPIFTKEGHYNIKSSGYYPLIELYNTEYHIIDYVTTYCILYNKSCINFINEVINICFDPNVILDYKKYLPMGDETVFNYLYSKYNFSEYISSNLCFDVCPFLPINDALNNLEKTKNFVSYIHTKRYITFDPYGKDFSNLRYDEYQQIFDILLSRESCDSNITIYDVKKNEHSDEIHFFVKNDYNFDYCFIKLISLFRPNKEYIFNITLNNETIFYIIKESDVWVKDTHLVIEKNKIIKDVTKII
jgi:hypothetical protein